MHTEKRPCEGIAKGGCWGATESGLKRNQTFQHLDDKLLASRTVRKQISVV